MRKAIYLGVILACGCHKATLIVTRAALAPSTPMAILVQSPCPAGTFDTVSRTNPIVDPNIKTVIAKTIQNATYYFVCDKEISLPTMAVRENLPPQ